VLAPLGRVLARPLAVLAPLGRVLARPLAVLAPLGGILARPLAARAPLGRVLAGLLAVLAPLGGILARPLAALPPLRRVFGDELFLIFQMNSQHELVPFAFRAVNWLTFDEGERRLRAQSGPDSCDPTKRRAHALCPRAGGRHTLRIERLASPKNRMRGEVQIRRWDADLNATSRQCAQHQQRLPGRDPAARGQHPPTCWIAGLLK
jgi:hypothetical protein